jgi:hypothetical protein
MLVLSVIFVVFLHSVSSVKLSIIWDEKISSYGLRRGSADDYISLVEYRSEINKTGWDYLDIKTNPQYNDIDQAYTAGLVEALVTSDLIKLHWHNTLEGYCTEPLSPYCQRLKNYVETNAGWMQKQFDAEADTNPYWHQVRLFLIQMQGLIDGYKFAQSSRPSLTKFIYKPDITGLLLFQIGGDLGDLESALKMEGKKQVTGDGHCSALVKLTPGNKDLYAAQDTWSGYNTMLRILKKYSFGYHLTPGSSQLIPGQHTTFSSYPGILLSLDDFYVISSGLVTMETTIGNDNEALWKYVQPTNSVFEAIRTVVANRLATSGSQWAQIFSQYNSGTYNNQWMIVDYNLFTPGASWLNDGLLYVLEQIPGMIMKKDVTEVLRNQSYWPSYNIAYFKEIFNASGGPEMVAKYGDWFTYERSPRANIFRRDHRKVVDVDSFLQLMRYNDYTNDPLSKCECTPPYSAENAISARCDLNPANGTYPFAALGHRAHGGLDAKLTTSTMMKSLEFVAVSGPTFDPLPPFQWSKSDYAKTVTHVGHPDLWTFKPVQHKWNL